MRRVLSWVAAVLGTLLLAVVAFLAAYWWYESHAMGVSIDVGQSGTTVSYYSFTAHSLLSAGITAAACTAATALLGFGVYFLSGGSLAPAIFTVTCGPVVACGADIVVSLRESTTIPAGQVDLAVNPIALVGRAIIFLAPVLFGILLLVWVGPGKKPEARSD